MVEYKAGMKLQLWVWDTGELEGFMLYKDGKLFDAQQVHDLAYEIDRPIDTFKIEVKFNGVDGGATKIVDIASGKTSVLASKDAGDVHAYDIKRA